MYDDEITDIHILCNLPDRVQCILFHQQVVDGKDYLPLAGPS